MRLYVKKKDKPNFKNCLCFDVNNIDFFFYLDAVTLRLRFQTKTSQNLDKQDFVFFVDKDITYKDELLGAVNEAIKKLGGGISELVKFHNDVIDEKTPEPLSFELLNLDDNTGREIDVYSSVDGPPFDYLGKTMKSKGWK